MRRGWTKRPERDKAEGGGAVLGAGLVGTANVEVGERGECEPRWPEEISAGGEILLLQRGVLERRRWGGLILAVDERRNECNNGSAGACPRGEKEEGR